MLQASCINFWGKVFLVGILSVLSLFLSNQVSLQLQELRDKASSPIGSTGSGADSIKSESASSTQDDRKSSDDAGTSGIYLQKLVRAPCYI